MGQFRARHHVSSNSFGKPVKYDDDDTDRHIDRGMCSELMNLFIKKNVSLSFADLIKFSGKHGMDLKVNFK